MMRILTVVKYLGPGGTERVAQNYALGYHRNSDTESAVLAFIGGGPRADVLTAAGVPVFVGGSEAACGQALDQAIAWQPDVVHIHRVGRADASEAFVLSRLRTANPALRVMETNVFGKPDYSANGPLVDLHLHLTPWSLWKWSQWVQGMSPPPVGTVVPYGVDTHGFFPLSPSERTQLRSERGLPSNAIVYGRVGQPLRPKWSEVLFQAFAKHARTSPKAHLVLVGMPEELRPALDALPEETRTRVHEWDFVHGDQALRRVYGCFDVFLHAADIGESFGMVFTEALLCGLPVISLSTPTHDNGQLFVVGHRRGGLLVSNAKAMARAMQELGSSPDLRRELAAHGASHVREHYNLERVTSLLIRIAEGLRSADAPEALRHFLQDNLHLSVKQDTSAIVSLASRVEGGLPLRDRVVMRALHTPFLYKIWSNLRFG